MSVYHPPGYKNNSAGGWFLILSIIDWTTEINSIISRKNGAERGGWE